MNKTTTNPKTLAANEAILAALRKAHSIASPASTDPEDLKRQRLGQEALGRLLTPPIGFSWEPFEIDGIPASLHWAICWPACKAASNWGTRCSWLCSCKLTNFCLIPKWFNNCWVCRVSSAAIKSTVLSTSSARIVISPRLPIGVGTRYNVPISVGAKLLTCCIVSSLFCVS